MLLRLVNSPPLPLATFSFIFSYLSFAAGQYVNPGNTTKVFFPTTSGKYDTGTFDLKFTDHSRTDPYSNTTIPRSILLQLFYPAENVEQYPLSSYMGPATAAYYQDTNQLPNNTFGSFKPNSHRSAPMRYCEQTQVILFSPGYGVSRLLYTGLAEDLASHGYLVISIDHPYDAPIVEFPDGSLAISNPPPLPENSTEFESFFKQQYETRVEDVLSILDPLYNNTLTKNIPGARGRLNISQVAMYGHSLGGATAAGAMLIDKRLLGGLNLDGSIFGDVLDQGLDRPYMIMAASDHNRTNDPSWETFWKKLQGWKRAVVLEGSTHMTFTDIPVIIKLINRPDILPPDIMELFVGSIDAYRAVDIQRSYILAFFNFLFGNKSGQLLNKPDRRYPEIKFWSF